MTIITGAIENSVKNASDPALAKALLSTQIWAACLHICSQYLRRLTSPDVILDSIPAKENCDVDVLTALDEID